MEKTHIDPNRAMPRSSPSPGNPPGPASSTTDKSDLQILGPFRILRKLGEGGMGSVLLAFDTRSSRQVALKILNESLNSDQHFIHRFYREARSGTSLNHPNIVRTFEAGRDPKTQLHFLVMEFIDGPSAHKILGNQGKLEVGDAVHIAHDIARALEHAHSQNIIHRDIKPDNILISRSGVAKLGDLGLSKRTDEASSLTSARQGFGTTAYMPYEQALSARNADARSDIYALGATLYHLLTGQVPFPADNDVEVIERKKLGRFTPASDVNPEIPPVLDSILRRMLARHPRDRYQTSSEVIIDLERTRLGAPVLSFADPELARQDPWAQVIGTSGEPTRLDPVRAARKSSIPAGGADVWLVRFAKEPGRFVQARLTTERIRQRLAEGSLPHDAMIRQTDQESWRPLDILEALRDLLPAASPSSAEATESPPMPASPSASRRFSIRAILLTTLILAILGGMLFLATQVGSFSR